MHRSQEDFRREWLALTNRTVSDVSKNGYSLPEAPSYKIPKLPTNLSDRSDHDLIDFMVRYCRWADHFSAQTTLEEILKAEAESALKRMENIFLLSNRSEKPVSGEVTLLKAQMDEDPEITSAREALRIIHNRVCLMKMLFEHAERDGALCSRELTRRCAGVTPDIRRRTDRVSP